jgi:hypothetical protein
MKEKKFRIIFKGEILPNANLEEVKQKLAAFYKVDIKEIESLFSGKNFVLKENATLDAAMEYMYQLEQAGALCQLDEMKTESKKDSLTTPAAGTKETTGATVITEAPGRTGTVLYFFTFFIHFFRRFFRPFSYYFADFSDVVWKMSRPRDSFTSSPLSSALQ